VTQEQLTDPEAEPTADELIEMFRPALPEDIIADMKGMDFIEVYELLMVAGPEHGIDDPEAVIKAGGLTEGWHLHSAAQMEEMNRASTSFEPPHSADEMWGDQS
jgi:hypothetical protein